MASHTATKEARNKAVYKYTKNNYDFFQVKFKKQGGLKDKIAEHILTTGESMNGFIQRACREAIENDKKKTLNKSV